MAFTGVIDIYAILIYHFRNNLYAHAFHFPLKLDFCVKYK